MRFRSLLQSKPIPVSSFPTSPLPFPHTPERGSGFASWDLRFAEESGSEESGSEGLLGSEESGSVLGLSAGRMMCGLGNFA